MSIKWGILGTAGIADKVCKAIDRANNAELVAIASRSGERAAAWAKEREIPRSYGSYEELLADPDIKAVYIPLPPTMHCEWAIKAAKAGKHVLSEKPLTVDTTEAEAIADACLQNGVQLMDGVMWVHHDWTRAVKDVQHSGDLGELRRVTASFSFYWGSEVPTDNIRAQKALGGGSLGDLGYYCVRAILWAFEEMPTSVIAKARYMNDIDVELSAMCMFSRDRTASFDCGFTVGGRSVLELAGTTCALRVDPFVVPLSENESSYSLSTGMGKADRVEVGGCVQEVKMIECFSNTVESGQLNSQYATDALNTVRVCSALAESAEAGREVSL